MDGQCGETEEEKVIDEGISELEQRNQYQNEIDEEMEFISEIR